VDFFATAEGAKTPPGFELPADRERPRRTAEIRPEFASLRMCLWAYFSNGDPGTCSLA
jgi:hypothetical protein